MMSIAQVRSAGSAGNYYTDKDNYYVLGSMGERWAGRGAEQLGLQGSVDKDVFTRLLEGRLPDGADLSRMQDGSNKHRPGYDLTFSAPKSVSMMAMLGGDKRLIDAHNQAVDFAVRQVEALASTRVMTDGQSETVLTGNLVMALFNHDTSRDQEPQLTALKLTGFRDALKKQLAQPGTYQELGFEERLSLLTAEELTCRENRKAERLIKHARFRLNAELSKLDYRNNRGLDRALIRSLSQGNWLTLKQNILLTGATGSGKTFLACALGHNACRQGYKVYYYRLKALMEQCYQGHADGRYSKLLTRLNNSDLLLLDDWGLEPLSSEQRSDLLEIVDLMYQRGSIIVVSQLPVENWYKMIGDSTHADAILDRLVHGSIKIELKGESMRKIQSPLTEGDQ